MLLVDGAAIVATWLLGSGATLQPFVVPNDPRLCGLVANLWIVEVDPGASAGWSFTPGLELVIGRRVYESVGPSEITGLARASTGRRSDGLSCSVSGPTIFANRHAFRAYRPSEQPPTTGCVMRALPLLLVVWFAACAAQPSRTSATEDRLVTAARAEVERQLAVDGQVDRFLVFYDADGATELGGVDGGGYGPSKDVLRSMMERGHFTAAADVTYPGSSNAERVETMLVTYIDALGGEGEVTMRLPRPVVRAPRSPR